MLTTLISLAQALSRAPEPGVEPRVAWAPVALLVIMGVGFAVTNVLASLVIGPSRTGPGKETTYESGMMPIGDTHKRFNVKFYVVAMIFLVVDVDIIFFYPWATIFAPYVQHFPSLSNVLLGEMIVFVVVLLVAYVYAWGKGVFRFD